MTLNSSFSRFWFEPMMCLKKILESGFIQLKPKNIEKNCADAANWKFYFITHEPDNCKMFIMIARNKITSENKQTLIIIEL
jgi:hypothetical protein